MGSLPLGKAGVGSAMNDTTRQVGGALGVAVLGSVLSSAYAARIAPALASLPRSAALAASDSIGATLRTARSLGGTGAPVAAAARAAFVSAMGTAVNIAALVALVGAATALLFLPSRPLVREHAHPGEHPGPAEETDSAEAALRELEPAEAGVRRRVVPL